MSLHLVIPQGTFLFRKHGYHSSVTLRHQSCSYTRKNCWFHNYYAAQSPLQGCLEVVDYVNSSHDDKVSCCDPVESETVPHVETLRRIPKEELVSKVVMVRFDSKILLREDMSLSSQSVCSAVYTIKYLQDARAKVILVSDWSTKMFSQHLVSDVLSSVLQCKVETIQCLSHGLPLEREVFEKSQIVLFENLSEFKEEVANCSKLANFLASGVDIFVNDSFSQSHKMLVSTVGVTRFCYACVAGFHFEECISQLMNSLEVNKKPCVAVIGGGNLHDKAKALHFLVSKCDGLIFVGMMSFQILHALGKDVPSNLLEREAHQSAHDIVQFAKDRSIPILCPEDFWCINTRFPRKLEIFSVDEFQDGWIPVDLGPKSLEAIDYLVTKCKKLIWIGPMKFKTSSSYTSGASGLTQILCKLSSSDCEVTAVGNMACTAMKQANCIPVSNMVENASVAWEFLRGRKLPGVMALDRAYPFKVDWKAVYCKPAQPLVVDIGSGNGLFIMGMAGKKEDLNFLGLEINTKLVNRCLDSVQRSGMKNGYFIATNATSTFRSIVSSYPGQLVLVSIQCPNPDFNKPEHRWRMLQRSLIEAVVDLLADNGKVFLQSDVEAVALRMKEQFLRYGKGKLVVMQQAHSKAETNKTMWVEENPFNVRSDWEQHVIDRGSPMYRLMLSKCTTFE